MKTRPTVELRGNVWVADMRPWGGQRRHSLGLPGEADPIEVGMACERAKQSLLVAGHIAAPELPFEDEGLLVRDLVSYYLEARAHDYETDGGASYVADYCRRIVKDLGHLPVLALAAPEGILVFNKWRDRLWEEKLANQTVKNCIASLFAVLRWGRSDGRRMTGPLPEKMPRCARAGQNLRNPRFEFWTEADFRHFRQRWSDEVLRTGGLRKHCGSDAKKVEDYLARRRMYLSLAFYTGCHVAELDGWRGDWLSVDRGRYQRHNQKSARTVRPIWLDMPEQLQIDCQEEVARLGRPWGDGELVGCGKWGPWKGAIRTLVKATKRLWPDGSRPAWNFMSLARRSTVREYTIRGWRTHEIAAILGHVDNRMVEEVYRRCEELGIISPVRVPWTVNSGPHGKPTGLAPVLEFRRA